MIIQTAPEISRSTVLALVGFTLAALRFSVILVVKAGDIDDVDKQENTPSTPETSTHGTSKNATSKNATSKNATVVDSSAVTPTLPTSPPSSPPPSTSPPFNHISHLSRASLFLVLMLVSLVMTRVDFENSVAPAILPATLAAAVFLCEIFSTMIIWSERTNSVFHVLPSSLILLSSIFLYVDESASGDYGAASNAATAIILFLAVSSVDFLHLLSSFLHAASTKRPRSRSTSFDAGGEETDEPPELSFLALMSLLSPYFWPSLEGGGWGNRVRSISTWIMVRAERAASGTGGGKWEEGGPFRSEELLDCSSEALREPLSASQPQPPVSVLNAPPPARSVASPEMRSNGGSREPLTLKPR